MFESYFSIIQKTNYFIMNEFHFTQKIKKRIRGGEIPRLAIITTRLLRFVVLLCIGLYGQGLKAQCPDCSGVVNEGLFCIGELPPPSSLIDISDCPAGTTITTVVPDNVITDGSGYSGDERVIERTYTIDPTPGAPASGDETSCSHTITLESTVIDIVCQDDISVTLESGACGEQVFFNPPTSSNV